MREVYWADGEKTWLARDSITNLMTHHLIALTDEGPGARYTVTYKGEFIAAPKTLEKAKEIVRQRNDEFFKNL